MKRLTSAYARSSMAESTLPGSVWGERMPLPLELDGKKSNDSHSVYNLDKKGEIYISPRLYSWEFHLDEFTFLESLFAIWSWCDIFSVKYGTFNKSGESEVSFKLHRQRENGMTRQKLYLYSRTGKKGLEAVPELLRVLINNAMQVERSKYLQAEEYERTEERVGHANGYKPKTVRTRIGDITFAVPQVREGGFYPSALEKGMRSERALMCALAEMYIQGVSTRKVKAITEELCGVEISAGGSAGSTAQLDGVLQEWRERSLGEITYLYVDAVYEKVREAGQVRDSAVLVASGINSRG